MMKKLLGSIPIWMMAILLFACQEGERFTPMTKAIITGYDARTCPCCGGYFVSIADNIEDINVAGLNFQWDGLSKFEGLDLGADFPIYLKIDYSINLDLCSASDGFIDISELKVIDK